MLNRCFHSWINNQINGHHNWGHPPLLLSSLFFLPRLFFPLFMFFTKTELWCLCLLFHLAILPFYGNRCFGINCFLDNPPDSMPLFRHFMLLLAIRIVSVDYYCVFAQQCTRNCSATLRHSLNAILGIPIHPSPVSSSLSLFVELSPLDTLIRISPNNVVVKRKTEWICNSVDKFAQCTDSCEENRLKLVEMANVNHWAVVCRTLFEHPETFSEFISCQRKLLANVAQRCRAPNATADKSEGPKMLVHFCKQMNIYARCYRRTAQKCTKNATKVSHQLSEAIGRSFARIHQVARGHMRIPAQCQQSIEILVASTEQRDSEANDGTYSTEDNDGEDYWLEGGQSGEQGGGQIAEQKVTNRAAEKNHFGTLFHFISFVFPFCFEYTGNSVLFYCFHQ